MGRAITGRLPGEREVGRAESCSEPVGESHQPVVVA
jgi:hypothetical protein